MTPIVERTLQQIVEDVMAGDLTAIEQLIQATPVQALNNYLPEGDIYTPEDRPSPNFQSARECAIDEQAAIYDDNYEE